MFKKKISDLFEDLERASRSALSKAESKLHEGKYGKAFTLYLRVISLTPYRKRGTCFFVSPLRIHRNPAHVFSGVVIQPS